MKFQVSSVNTFRVMLRAKFKNENEQMTITPKAWSFELWFLCATLIPNENYLPMRFHVNALHSFEVMIRTKFQNENEHRAITLNIACLELWFLCTALLLNEIYLPMKVHVNALPSFKVMLRTKQRDGQTDWRTEGQTGGRTSRLLYANLRGA